ncbi:hybrid sensor histidine kinase/response regulator [Sulfuricurvum sp.]|uniref:hybrid sensor histidine kinase/response regulator n=1 Tax=Sulfuricurvum sp. TaxID=2025608 RepID=UPI002610C15E|nr:hybrid sensor histidine kinase/response regulator [Sulfuricurvum sp.]MDD3595616.1 ATP-binding protein [Sulfuricurvum sp.]
MSLHDISGLYNSKMVLIAAKEEILQDWVAEEECASILQRHEIDQELFIAHYAGNVFDYFMGVVSGQMVIGECPVIADLIEYLKNKDLRADELFTLCTHFKRAVLNSTYRMGINSPEIFTAVSYLFDRNFAGVLKLYTDTIYQKEQEAINASKAKEYFLSNMSHEIRTPLNAILGFVSLLRDETINPRYQKYLDIISNSGENLLHIINDILDFSKLRSGEFAIDPQPFNIHDEISHTMELFVPSANSKSITLTSFIDPSIPYEIIADAVRIKQIVGNFLSNAIKFSHPEGAIHVEARYDRGLLSLSVRDDGIGISSADQQRIFDAFSQAYEGVIRINEGTGLGLSICKQLAQHMGGTIELQSALGEGSLFTLSIPVVVNHECEIAKFDISMFEGIRFGLLEYDPSESYKLESLQRYWDHFGLDVCRIKTVKDECDLLIFLESSIDDETREYIIEQQIPSVAILDFLDDRYDTIETITPLTFPIYCTKLQNALSEVLGINQPSLPTALGINSGYGFSGRILVAEDNHANQELIRIVLERYGLEYVIASNGVEALELYCSQPFDLILMDEQMPYMNGNEATLSILAYEEKNKKPHTPIVALTANVIKGARERSIQNGYDAFLGKPIVLKEIEQIFDRYLSPKPIQKNEQKPKQKSKWPAIDMEHLKSALMLDEEQIDYLLGIYCQKMEHSLRELENAIAEKAYEDIPFIAHSIKGSSANFRFDELSRLAYVIEESALNKDKEFDFDEAYSVLHSEFSKRFMGEEGYYSSK